jgi:hypothetical protein
MSSSLVTPDVVVGAETPSAHLDDRTILLLNPGHGNEPYILATAIGREIGKQFISAGLRSALGL